MCLRESEDLIDLIRPGDADPQVLGRICRGLPVACAQGYLRVSDRPPAVACTLVLDLQDGNE